MYGLQKMSTVVLLQSYQARHKTGVHTRVQKGRRTSRLPYGPKMHEEDFQGDNAPNTPNSGWLARGDIDTAGRRLGNARHTSLEPSTWAYRYPSRETAVGETAS